MKGYERISAPEPYELWLVDLSIQSNDFELAALSQDERDRAERFVFAMHRRRYLRAHSVLRKLLAGRVGLDPKSLTFDFGPFGKPSLAAQPTCSYNLSDSEDIALIAFAPEGEIGVDLEVTRSVEDLSDLAQRNFTAVECEELEGVCLADRDLAFLTLWTRKEACLKAVGSGLSIAPHTFEVGLHARVGPVAIGGPFGVQRVEVHTLTQFPPGSAAVGAIARVLPR